jgi:sugar phosphate isomerase/epimerase
MNQRVKFGTADWNLWPISNDYEVVFPQIKQMGISYVEIGIYTPSKELSSSRIAEIVNLQKQYGVEISAALFSLTPEFWPNGALSNLESNFLSEFDYFLRALEQLGIRNANIWTGADGIGADSDSVNSSLKQMNQLAANFDGVVSIEYKADTVFPDGMSLLKQLEKYEHLKVLLDTGHAFALEEDVLALLKVLQENNKLGAMHLGDAIPGDSDADLPCGRVHDFQPIFRKMQEVQFNGPANFDLYGAAVDVNGPGPIPILQESQDHVVKSLGRIDQ